MEINRYLFATSKSARPVAARAGRDPEVAGLRAWWRSRAGCRGAGTSSSPTGRSTVLQHREDVPTRCLTASRARGPGSAPPRGLGCGCGGKFGGPLERTRCRPASRRRWTRVSPPSARLGGGDRCELRSLVSALGRTASPQCSRALGLGVAPAPRHRASSAPLRRLLLDSFGVCLLVAASRAGSFRPRREFPRRSRRPRAASSRSRSIRAGRSTACRRARRRRRPRPAPTRRSRRAAPRRRLPRRGRRRAASHRPRLAGRRRARRRPRRAGSPEARSRLRRRSAPGRPGVALAAPARRARSALELGGALDPASFTPGGPSTRSAAARIASPTSAAPPPSSSIRSASR